MGTLGLQILANCFGELLQPVNVPPSAGHPAVDAILQLVEDAMEQAGTEGAPHLHDRGLDSLRPKPKETISLGRFEPGRVRHLHQETASEAHSVPAPSSDHRGWGCSTRPSRSCPAWHAPHRRARARDTGAGRGVTIRECMLWERETSQARELHLETRRERECS